MDDYLRKRVPKISIKKYELARVVVEIRHDNLNREPKIGPHRDNGHNDPSAASAQTQRIKPHAESRQRNIFLTENSKQKKQHKKTKSLFVEKIEHA